MGASPSGNLVFQASIDAVGAITQAADQQIPAGLDLSGAQVVFDGIGFGGGTLDATLQGHSASPTDTPAPAFQGVIDGAALLVAGNGTSSLGGADQIIEIGHLRTLRLLVTAAGGPPTGGTVTVYLSSVGTVGN